MIDPQLLSEAGGEMLVNKISNLMQQLKFHTSMYDNIQAGCHQDPGGILPYSRHTHGRRHDHHGGRQAPQVAGVPDLPRVTA